MEFINVLLIEANPKDAASIAENIIGSGKLTFHINHAASMEGGLAQLVKGDVNIILLNLELPDSSGLTTLEHFISKTNGIPIVVITESDNEEIGYQALQNGAQDYIIKNEADGIALAHILLSAIHRHQQFHRIQTSERYTRSIIENNVDGILIVDQEGLVRFANPSAEILFNRPVEKLVGVSFGFPIGSNKPSELEIQQPDGSVVVAELRTIDFSWDNQPAYLASLRDVTKRVQMTAALKASEMRYRQVVDNVHDIIYSGKINSDHLAFTLSFISRQTEIIMGYSPDEFISSPNKFIEIVHPADLEKVEKEFAQALKDGKPCRRCYRIKHKNSNSYIWLEDDLIPQLNAKGKVVGFFGAARDITERKNSEEALKQRAEEFAGLYATVLEIASPHELPTFLQTIVERSAHLLGADGGGMYLCDHEQQKIHRIVNFPMIRNSNFFNDYLQYGEGAIGRVAQSGEPLNINVFQSCTGQDSPLKENSLKGLILSPMLWQGDVIGVIYLERLIDKTPFTQNDLDLLTIFANHAAFAVENSRLVEGLKNELHVRKQAEEAFQRKAFELQTLYQTSLEIASQEDLDSLLSIIVRRATSLVGVGSGALYLVQNDNRTLRLVVGHNVPNQYIGIQLNFGEDLSGKIAQSGESMIIEDYQVWDDRVSLFNDFPIKGVLGVPLKVKDKVIGVIEIFDMTTVGSFTEAEIQLVRLFADQAALAIEEARLFEQERTRTRDLAALYNTTKRLSSDIDLDAVISTITQEMVQISHSYGCTLYVPKFGDDEIVALADYRRDYDDKIDKKEVVYQLSQHPAALYVIKSKQPLVYTRSDINIDLAEKSFMEAKGASTLLILPLLRGNKVISLIELYEDELEREYRQEEIHILQSIATQAATVIENSKLFEEAQRRLRQTTALHEIDQAINESVNIQPILEVVLKHAKKELGVDAALILLYDPVGKTLKYELGSGFRTKALQFTNLSLGEGYAGWVAINRQPIYLTNLQNRTTDFLRSPAFHQEDFVCYFGVPLIAKNKIKGVLELFHRSPLNPDNEWMSFLETIAGQIAIAIDNAILYEDLQHSNYELTMAYDATIEGWSKALDLRDKETEGHTKRVTELTMQMTREMNISEEELIHIRRGSLLHDIGKMGIPDSILLKPDKLSDDEWQLMRKHPVFAYEMLSPIHYLERALEIPYCHHEKWDGTGYPRGLKGEEIPLSARIFSIVDVWDALNSDRPYRTAWSRDKALAYIKEQSGKHFDPMILEVFTNLLSRQRYG